MNNVYSSGKVKNEEARERRGRQEGGGLRCPE